MKDSFYQILMKEIKDNPKTSWGKNELAVFIRDLYIKYLEEGDKKDG